MTAIIFLIWRIATLRAGPDALPANNLLLGLVILVNATISITATYLINAIGAQAQTGLPPEAFQEDISFFTTLTQVIVNQASTAGLTWLVMYLMNHPKRVPQTLIALFGVDALITTMAGILVCVALFITPAISSIAFLLLMIWTLAAYGFIFHRALEIAMGFGIAVAIFVMLFAIAISQVILIS